MPVKGGRLTGQERAFASAYAATADQSHAVEKAGFSSGVSGWRALQRPAVQDEIARIQTERLFSEILPLAVQTHIEILKNPQTPAGARVQAVKLAYDRTLGTDQALASKQPHEMTPDELQEAITKQRLLTAALESTAADRARPIIEPEPGILD